MDPVTFSFLGVLAGGMAIKWIEMTLDKGRTKKQLAAENQKEQDKKKSEAERLESEYHCPVVFQRQLEDKFIEAGIIEPVDKTVCDEEGCSECLPTRRLVARNTRDEQMARAIQKREHYDMIQEWKRLNRPGGYKFI